MSLAQPKTISSAVITSSLLGTAGTDFFIKVGRFRIRVRNGPVADTTGDGDSAPSFDMGYWQYTDIALAGWMPSAANTGTLTNQANTSKNPVNATVKLSLSTNHHITIPSGSALITDWQIDYGRNESVIPIFVNIKTTYSLATWSST